MASEHSESEHDALWRGIDLSGITLVLGVGEGRLVETLATQARVSVSGHVLSMGLRVDDLIKIRYVVGDLPVSLVAARPRAIPLQDGSVDLLVMSGTLRQVPVTSLHTLFEEIWRVLVPGGQLRIADIIEPSEAHYNEAWRQRNTLITKLAEALNRPTALYANLTATAEALNTIGFENLAVSLLPGYPLTDAWLDATEEAVLGMVSRVTDPDLRESILEYDLPRLIRAYRSAEQRATERFVLRGSKVGSLALDMEASFIEDDLVEDDDD